MAIKSAPFYWVECDGCGQRAQPYDGVMAWADEEQAVTVAELEGFGSEGGKHLCIHCTIEREEEHP